MTWDAVWGLWLLAFAVAESIALLNERPADTLSEKVWQWFSIKGRGRAWRIRRFTLLSFLAWLAVHFLTGGFV